MNAGTHSARNGWTVQILTLGESEYVLHVYGPLQSMFNFHVYCIELCLSGMTLISMPALFPLRSGQHLPAGSTI